MNGAVACALLALTLASVSGLDLKKGVIVHLFEWRWDDVARECEDFLAPKMYAGVQISPPNENLVIKGRPWYERYQPVSYKLDTRSGDRRRLADMVRRCNAVGVKVFADTVINHMTKGDDAGGERGCRGTAGTRCVDAALWYPGVPYNRTHFNWPQCQIEDYNEPVQVRNCELVGLHDLNQTQSYVRFKIVDFMNDLIDLGIAGFRIDAAKHMWPSDLKQIYGGLKNLSTEHGFEPNTRPFIYQEVSCETWEKITYDEYSSMGLVTDFRYGSFVGTAFLGQNLSNLINFGPFWKILPDNESVVFIDNHDTERSDIQWLVHYKTPRPYKMAIAFMLARGIGTPQILSSFEHASFQDGPPVDHHYHHQRRDDAIKSPLHGRGVGADGSCSDGWVCQHRWPQVCNMVYFHEVTKGLPISSWWGNGFNQIAFSLGDKGFVAFNAEKFPMRILLETNLPPGQYCDIISGDIDRDMCHGNWHTVHENGTVLVEIGAFDKLSKHGDGVMAFLNTKSTMHGKSEDDEDSEENDICEDIAMEIYSDAEEDYQKLTMQDKSEDDEDSEENDIYEDITMNLSFPVIFCSDAEEDYPVF